MSIRWTERNTIVANLFNPAFCGEIIRIAIKEYNKHSKTEFPYAFAFLILPIVLHNDTRNRMPRSVKTYFFVWVEKNDDLFFDFAKRTKSMVKYTKEAIMFLLVHKKLEINEDAKIIANGSGLKIMKKDDYEEYNNILKKAAMLGKWLSTTSDVKSIYSFLRITP